MTKVVKECKRVGIFETASLYDFQFDLPSEINYQFRNEQNKVYLF